MRPVALALCLLLCACARRPTPSNVLLIVVDTLRWDHISAYGYERATTPHLDALARDGIRFTHTQSPRAKTTPAVATLMTGLYPHDHGVRDLTTPLQPGVTTLAEQLRGGGFMTGAIVGNYVLRQELSGLHRGFEVWIDDLPDRQGVPPGDVPQRTARSLTDEALALLGLTENNAADSSLVADDRPWFLWLHYMDPHGRYDPPPEYLAFTSESPHPLPATAPAFEERIATYNVADDARLPDGRIDANRMRDRYDGEIHYVDAEIGRLVEHMEAAGLLEDTWVVFVADHGESLGEHDYWFEHGMYAYEATCRVPLIVRPPTGMPKRPAPGVRHADLSLADLAPTLLDWAGVRARRRVHGPLTGKSRAQLLDQDDEQPHPVFSERVDRSEKSRAIQTKAVRIGDWKLLRSYAQRVTGGGGQTETTLLSEELYDLASDSREEHDRRTDPPASAPLDRLRDALDSFLAADRDFEDLARVLQERRESLSRDDPETLRRLEALGY